MVQKDSDRPKRGPKWLKTPRFGIFHRLRPYLCSKRDEVGFHKQPTHRRPGDEPFFYSGVDRSWLGMAQKWSILDQKWPNMAGLSTLQSGPKGTNIVNLSVFDHLRPYLSPSRTLLGHFRQKWFLAQNGQSRVLQRCFGAKYQFLFEMVQKGPDGPKRVPNDQKDLGWPFWSLLGPFGPLWRVDKPAMFDHFWSKIGHFWTTPVYLIVKKKVHHQLYPVFCKSQRFRYDLISFDSCKQQQLLSSPLILFHPFRSQRKCADSWGPPSNLAKIRRVQVNVMMIPDM